MTFTAEQIEEAKKHLPSAYEMRGRYWRVIVREGPTTLDFSRFRFDLETYDSIRPTDLQTIDFYSGRMYLKSGATFWTWKMKYDGMPVEWDETDLEFKNMPKIAGPIFEV